jgi:hypothetical protein
MGDAKIGTSKVPGDTGSDRVDEKKEGDSWRTPVQAPRQTATAIRMLTVVALLVYGLGLFSLTYLYLGPTHQFAKHDQRVVSLAERDAKKGLSLEDLFKALTGFLAAASTLRLVSAPRGSAPALNVCIWSALLLIFLLSALWSEGMDYLVVKTVEYEPSVYEGLQKYAYGRFKETLIILGTLASGLVRDSRVGV